MAASKTVKKTSEEKKLEMMFTPLQEDIHSRLEKALGQIESLDKTTEEIKHEVEDAEKDLEKLDEKKKGKKNPGVAVNNMLKKLILK